MPADTDPTAWLSAHNQGRKYTDELLILTSKIVMEMGDTAAAADALGCSRQSVRRRIQEARKLGLFGATTINPRGPVLETAEEILKRRADHFSKGLHLYGHENVVEVENNGPLGIFHFGDTHVDDDGVDAGLLLHHVQLVQNTPGMLAACVGDYTNNWGVKHAHLQAEHGMSKDEAASVVEWFLTSMPFAYLVEGNHDVFRGPLYNVLCYLRRDAVVLADGTYDVRLRLDFPNGVSTRLWARHSFKGRSMWNILHSLVRAMKDADSYPADLYIMGHLHEWGCTQIPIGDRVATLLQVGTYKRRDDYAARNQYPPRKYGEAVVTILVPTAPPHSRVQVFWDVEEGCDRLTWLRRRGA